MAGRGVATEAAGEKRGALKLRSGTGYPWPRGRFAARA